MSWTDDDEAILREWYPQMPAKHLARLMGKSHYEVHKRANALGIRRCAKWTAVEDQAVRFFYWRGAHLCHGVLQGRTVGAIWARAWRLGLSTAREDWDE